MLENEVVLKIAEKNGKSPAQVLLRFIIQKDIAVIPKSTNPQRLAENIQVSTEVRLWHKRRKNYNFCTILTASGFYYFSGRFLTLNWTKKTWNLCGAKTPAKADVSYGSNSSKGK